MWTSETAEWKTTSSWERPSADTSNRSAFTSTASPHLFARERNGERRGRIVTGRGGGLLESFHGLVLVPELLVSHADQALEERVARIGLLQVIQGGLVVAGVEGHV